MVILFVGMLFLFQNDCYAGTQRLNSLDYQVQLNMDGSMDVVETWDIYVSETNTLFKDFKLDEKCNYVYSAQVKDLDTGLDLTNINQEMYHVTTGCYYALPVEMDKFEIAWGVGLDDSSANKRYQISYTINDAVKSYQDCSEFYWQFIGTDNGVPADRVTGTIKLPSPVADLEKLRVWAHGPLNGEIYKTANDTVSFYVDNLASGKMLEARVVVEEPIFLCREWPENKLQSILQEEAKWADKANQQRKRGQMLIVAGIVLQFVLVVLLITRIVKYKRILREIKEAYGEIDIGKYFREIPREDATPAEAAFLYYFKNNIYNADLHFSNIFSGTLLQLCLKKYISLEKEGKKDIKINLLETNGEKLKPTEKTILELLVNIAGTKQSLTMEEIKKFVKKHYKEFGEVMTKIEKETKQANVDLEYFDEEKNKEYQKYATWEIVYVMATIFAFILMIPFGILLLILALECLVISILLNKIIKKIKVLTEKGQTEKQQWKGLAKYMEDFSMLNERDIPDLILWEKYLVYATVFGIADKVVKQLKLKYPEFNDLSSGTYCYMYLVSDFDSKSGFFSTLDSLSTGISASYISSSSSGSGGGFSSGGGGRRWRWPEWEEDKESVRNFTSKISLARNLVRGEDNENRN